MGPHEVIGKALTDNVDPLAIRPSNPLKGRNRDGTFKMAPAKEYPSRLCRTLILATLTSIKHRLTHFGHVEATSLAQDERDWIEEV